MCSSGRWRRFGAAFCFAIGCVLFAMIAPTPAAALPIEAGPPVPGAAAGSPGSIGSCPASLPDEPGATYTIITAGPLGPNTLGGPYCGQTGGPLNPTSGGECPIGFTPAVGGTFDVPVCDLNGNIVTPSPSNKTRQKTIIQFSSTIS
jgi:hypothetical protein